jgi:hypothetical protein
MFGGIREDDRQDMDMDMDMDMDSIHNLFSDILYQPWLYGIA